MSNNIFAPMCAAKRAYPHLCVKSKRTNLFLLAASTSALAVAMPGVASAQAVPAGCTPDPASNGDIVTCIAPPTPITGISTTVDDLTINIGNASTPTTVNEAAGDGINMRGGGFQTINIYNAGSSVTGSDDGIDIRVLAGGGDISITSQGSISGGDQGIEVYNLGAGSLTIDVVDATGTTRDGIFARNYGSGISVTSTGTVSGGDEGVTAINDGSGDLTVSLNNVYGGATGYGLTAINSAGGNDLNITATGTISGGAGGILSQNSGAGDFTININNVDGATSDGIFATNTAAGMNLLITASGTVSGGTFGIRARNSGSGALTIDVDDVSGGTSTGILATNLTAATTDVLVTSTGAVIGSAGIQADNYGTGSTTISAVDVTGTTGYGILAVNRTSGLGTDVTVTSTGDVMGVVTGILGDNYGSGALTINAMNVTGTGAGADGIRGVNRSPGSDLSITALGTVSGGDDGIDALNFGTGATSITTTGTVIGTTGRGIFASNSAAGTSITVDAGGDMLGNIDGIIAFNFGSGALSVTTQAVTGTTNNGINTFNSTAGTSLTINAQGAVLGDDDGINARNLGTAGLTISAGGDVTGTTGQGINAYNSANDLTASLVINQAVGTTTTGALNGIYADNAGGSLTINALGTTIGQADDGIYANNNVGATNLTIVANNATGGTDGIDARNSGTGFVSITTTGTVTGTAGIGISARNDNLGTSLTINSTAGSVTGGDEGIYARNDGSGALSVTTAAVTGGQSGIEVYNYGFGVTTISISGAVVGMTQDGVYAVTGNGVDITINSGGSVSGAISAIRTAGIVAPPGAPADDTVTLNAGGSTSGGILLLAGDDIFNDAGGTFTNAFGGYGADSVNFSGTGRMIAGSGSVGDSLQEFEIFNFTSGGFDLSGDHVGLDETNFLSGVNTLSGTLTSATASIADGATLNAADGALLTGILTNEGVLNIGNSPGTFTINGDFIQTATGVLPIEIDGAAHDMLVVTGDVTLAGTLDVTILGGVPLGVSTRTIIDGGGALNGMFDNTNISGSGLLIAQVVELDVPNAEVNLISTLNSASSISSLTDNQTDIGDNLIGLLSNSTLDPDLVDLIISVGGISDEAGLAASLEGLHPEGLDMGLKFLTSSQGRFLDLVMAQSQPGPDDGLVQIASLNGGPVSVSNDDGPRVWGAFQVFGLDQDGGGEHLDFDGEAFEFAIGVSGITAGPVSFGIAGGYSNFDGDSDGALSDNVDAKIFHVAASVQAELGLGGFNTHIDSIASYAGGDSEFVMNLIDPTTATAVVQRGDADIASFDWLTRLTIDGTKGRDWVLKPYLQGGVSIYNQDATNIGAVGATALVVDELDNTRFEIGIGASFNYQVSDHLVLRASATGVQYFGDTQNVFLSRFASAPAGGPGFQTFGKEVERQVELDASLAYRHESGLVFGIGLFGEIGDINLYGANISISKSF